MQNSLTAKKERDSWFDNIKGFLMICVVVGHLIGTCISKYPTMNFLYHYIYSFHMPAFAIVSGYFMKRRVENKDYASVINKTLVPYLFAQVFVYLIGFVVPNSNKSLSLGIFSGDGEFSFFFPLYQLWYFAAVMFAFVFCVAVKADKKPLRAFVLSLIISVGSGVFSYVQLFKLSKSMAFLPFFVIGFICTSNFMNNVKKRKILIIPSVLIIGASAICLWMLRHEESPIAIFSLISRLQNFAFGIPFEYAILVWLGFIFGGTLISFSIFVISPRKKTPLAILGRRSNYIFVLHAFVVAVVRNWHIEKQILFELDSPLAKVLFLVFCVGVCYLLASKPITTIFRPLIEPNFDVRKIKEYLNIE